MEQDEHLAAFLRASRPEPSQEFVDGLERRLLGPAPRTARARRPWLAAFAAATGLAVALLVFALAGVGPLGSNDTDVRAKPRCVVQSVPGTVTTPVLVHTAGGDRIEYRRHQGVKRVKRCVAR